VVETLETILDAPHPPLSLQVSIDGLRETHDAIRGIPGSFDRAVETIRRCRELADRAAGFRVAVLTVVCDRNYGEIDELSRFLFEECGVMHGFELIRGSSFSVWGLARDAIQPGDPKGLGLPPREAWPDILETLRDVNRREGFPHELFALRHKYQFAMFDGVKPPIPCHSAGNWSGFVYPDGDVALCEFSRPVGNLADHNWDFGAVWHSEEAERRRRQIRHCYCTHSCNLCRNLEISLKAHVELIRWL
jgi:MoaA/NifB/PqqE/SkfB family radical SAM enzyme